MSKLFVLALLLGGLTSPFAGAEPAGLDPDQWAKLLTRIQTKGQRFETDIYVGQSLSKTEPEDKNKPHHMSAVTAAGRLANGQFMPRSTSMVVEDWSLTPAGDWHVDQWIFEANIEGELARVGHYLIDESTTGSVLHYEPVSLQNVSEEVLRAQFLKELAPWLTGQY